MDRRSVLAKGAALSLSAAFSWFVPKTVKLALDASDTNICSPDKQKEKAVQYLMEEYNVPEKAKAEKLVDKLLRKMSKMGLYGAVGGLATFAYASENRDIPMSSGDISDGRLRDELKNTAFLSASGAGIAYFLGGFDPQKTHDKYGMPYKDAKRFCHDCDLGHVGSMISGIAFASIANGVGDRLVEWAELKEYNESQKVGKIVSNEGPLDP